MYKQKNVYNEFYSILKTFHKKLYEMWIFANQMKSNKLEVNSIEENHTSNLQVNNNKK